MRVLAIDPGYGRCGVAILEKENGPSTPFDPSTELRVVPRNSRDDKAQGKSFGVNKERVIYSACIETSAKNPFAERLAHIAEECTRLVKKHKPGALALERLFFNSNQKTAFQVAEVRGAIIHVATRAKLPVFEYTPGQIKSATTGNGRADKKSMATMIHALVKIEKEITHDDEYDAIAVGITHLACAR